MPQELRLLVSSDTAGFEYKDAILADLKQDPHVASVEDLGIPADDRTASTYPRVVIAAATKIGAGEAGIGVAISANKVPGIGATVAHDSFSVERSILSNDCQVLTMGRPVIGLHLARRLDIEWLTYEFDPTSHSQANVAELEAYESERVR